MHVAAHCITNLDSFYAVAIALRNQGYTFIDVPLKNWCTIPELNSGSRAPAKCPKWIEWIYDYSPDQSEYRNCKYADLNHSIVRVILWPATLDKPR